VLAANIGFRGTAATMNLQLNGALGLAELAGWNIAGG